MKSYFKNQLLTLPDIDIPPEDIASYRELVICEMEKMGASKNEKELLHDMTICNAIKCKRLPEDVAWAILQ